MNSHPASGERFLLMKPVTVSYGARLMAPPWPMSRRTAPCQARKSATVTTKDGMPTRATR